MIWYRVEVSIYVKEVDSNDAQKGVARKLEEAGLDDFEIHYVDIAGRTHQVLYE